MTVRHSVAVKFECGASLTLEEDGEGKFLMTLGTSNEEETTILTDSDGVRSVATVMGQFVDEHGPD